MNVKLIDHMGNDLSVVNAARVSFAKESELEWNGEGYPPEEGMVLKDKDVKLINYLAKHITGAPLDMLPCNSILRLQCLSLDNW